MNRLAAFLVLACLTATSFATDYYWAKDASGVANGVVTDAAHWHAGSASGATGTMPGSGDKMRSNSTYDFTITFPDGVYTNYANVWPKVLTGQTITLDGRNGTFAHAEDTNRGYDYRSFRVEDNGGGDICQIENNSRNSGTYDYHQKPNFEFKDWKVTISSPTAKTSTISFDAGSFNFLNPCGFEWSDSQTAPSLMFFNFGQSATVSRDLAEATVHNGASLKANILALQGNAASNVFRIVGGSHQIRYLQMPLNVNGWQVGATRTVTDLILEEGADLDIAKGFFIGALSKATNHLNRVFVKENTTLTIPALASAYYGEQCICADGGTIVFGTYANTLTQTYTSNISKPVVLAAKNGGRYVFDHQDSSGSKFLGFGLTGTGLVDEYLYRVDFDASTVQLNKNGKWNLYSAAAEFKNGSSILNEGTFIAKARVDVTLDASSFENRDGFRLDELGKLALKNGSSFVNRRSGTVNLVGSAEGEGLLIADGSSITNEGTFRIAMDYAFRLVLTNGASFYTTNRLCLAGINNSVVTTPTVGTLDIHDSTLTIGGTAGEMTIAYARGTKAVVNMYSGLIQNAPTRERSVNMDIGYEGEAVFNLYGGTVRIFRPRLAINGNSEAYDTLPESKFCQYGGEFICECAGNGAKVGFSVGGESTYGGTRRRARVVLNGGRFSSYTTYGGVSSRCLGGSGWTAFEADGGTITSPTDTSSFILDFDEAVVGPKGLTIDSDGHSISMRQHVWANKPGEEGRIVFTGEGLKSTTGNVSRVSNIVLAGGTTDLSKIDQLTVQNLIVTNDATLKLDPTVTLLATSATFGNFFLDLSKTTAVGGTYALIRVQQPLSAESLVGWQRAMIAAGIPSDAAYDLTQEEDGGDYVLTLTVRQPQNTDIVLASGSETRGGDVFFPVADAVTAKVGKDAVLTLTGKYECGTFVKDGEGVLKLTSADNLFIPGFLLKAGGVSLVDLAPFGVGKAASVGGFRAKNGVLEITGPADGLSVQDRITLEQDSTNDIFVIKNDVDVTMPLPIDRSQVGEFVKRGAGTLTFTVEGASSGFVGGHGYGKINSNYGVWGGLMDSINQLTFDETSGMVTSSGVPAFLIAEGELRFVGVGDGAAVTLRGLGCVGVSTKVGTVQPGLVLDNVVYQQSTHPDTWFYMGAGVNSTDAGFERDGDFATAPYVVLTNNATLKCAQFEVGHKTEGTATPRLEVDGSFLNPGNWFTPNAADDGSVAPQVVFRNGSRLGTRQIRLTRPVTVDFDGTEIANYEHGAAEPIIITPLSYSTVSTATLNFRNGSRLYCKKVESKTLNVSKYGPVTLTFDDSEWLLTNKVEGAIDFTYPETVKVIAEVGGLKMPVPAGATWTMNHAVEGEGGLVSNGEGTLRLDETTVAYAGATRAEAGASVDFGGLEQTTTIAGEGTFRNGTLKSGGIAVSVDEKYVSGDVPTAAADLAFAGVTRVDLGRTEENPLVEPFGTFEVLRYEGSAPDVSGFRLKGTGLHQMGGVFEAKNGVVTCTPRHVGMMLIIR